MLPGYVQTMTFFRKESKSTHSWVRILNDTTAPIYHTSGAVSIPDICSDLNINFLSLKVTET